MLCFDDKGWLAVFSMKSQTSAGYLVIREVNIKHSLIVAIIAFIALPRTNLAYSCCFSMSCEGHKLKHKMVSFNMR